MKHTQRKNKSIRDHAVALGKRIDEQCSEAINGQNGNAPAILRAQSITTMQTQLFIRENNNHKFSGEYLTTLAKNSEYGVLEQAKALAMHYGFNLYLTISTKNGEYMHGYMHHQHAENAPECILRFKSGNTNLRPNDGIINSHQLDNGLNHFEYVSTTNPTIETRGDGNCLFNAIALFLQEYSANFTNTNNSSSSVRPQENPDVIVPNTTTISKPKTRSEIQKSKYRFFSKEQIIKSQRQALSSISNSKNSNSDETKIWKQYYQKLETNNPSEFSKIRQQVEADEEFALTVASEEAAKAGYRP